MRTIEPVGHVGRIREGLEAVRAAGWDVERDLLLVTQLEAFPVAVGRRAGTQIHHDIEDRPVRAADQLGLTGPLPYVHAADDPAARARETVLGEGGRIDPG